MMRVELTGQPHKLVMPPLCAHCGGPAQQRVPFERVFVNRGESRVSSHVVRVNVPLCSACAAVHYRELRRFSILDHVLSLFRSPMMIGVLGAGLVSLLTAQIAVKKVVDASVSDAAFFLLPAVIFGVLAARLLYSARSATRHHTMAPPTSVSRSFEFSDNDAELFEERHHTYKMKNAAFANGFIAVNRHRLWSRQMEAKASFRRRILYTVIGIGAGIAILYGIYEDWRQ